MTLEIRQRKCQSMMLQSSRDMSLEIAYSWNSDPLLPILCFWHGNVRLSALCFDLHVWTFSAESVISLIKGIALSVKEKSKLGKDGIVIKKTKPRWLYAPKLYISNICLPWNKCFAVQLKGNSKTEIFELTFTVHQEAMHAGKAWGNIML